MSSPQTKRPYQPPQRLSDPSLPLQTALAYLLVRALPTSISEGTTKVYSDGFITSILALVSREIFEVGDSPSSFEELRRDVDVLLKPETERIKRLNDKLQSRGQEVNEERTAAAKESSWLGDFADNFVNVSDGAAFLDNLERDLRHRINENDEEDVTEFPEPIERRSPLGLYLRGLLLALRKMSFVETVNISRQVGRWCGVQPGPSSFPGSRKFAMEETMSTRLQAMDRMSGSIDSGDYSGSIESLRRFYDYQFPNAGRGKHQHALLNLAAYHHSCGGTAAAKEAINEAIRVARAEGDKLCLSQCISLLHRIEMESIDAQLSRDDNEVSEGLITSPHIPPASSPMDELWTIRTALDKGEPVHITMRRIYQALGRYQSNRTKPDDKQMQGWTTEYPFDEASWHAAQAGIWDMLGSNTLSELHQQLALECEEGGRDARLTVLLLQARQMSTRGEYETALAALLDFENVDGLDIASYQRWTSVVWSVLRRQAELGDNVHVLDQIAALEAIPQSDEEDRGSGSVQSKVNRSLRRATKMTESGSPAHLVLPGVLATMQLCGKLGLWPSYRSCVVTFSEVLLNSDEHGMSQRAVEEVEKVWPEIITSSDHEVIARAALVLAKATIDVSLDTERPELMTGALAHLEKALEHAKKVGAIKLIRSASSLTFFIAAARGDETISSTSEADDGRIDTAKMSDRMRQISDIVKLVGVRVSENWQ